MTLMMTAFTALDFVAAAVLWQPTITAPVVAAVGWLVLLKGLYSMGLSYAAGNKYDYLGWIDVAVGTVMLLGVVVPFLWVLPLTKGAWSAIGVYVTKHG